MRLSDGQPIHGDVLAVIDESSPVAGAGVYYVVTAAVVFDPSNIRHCVSGVVGERTSPFHYRREGPEAIERMATLLENMELMASVLWRPVARRGQVVARRDLLAAHARRLAHDGVTHVIIESGDETSDQRDQEILLDTFATEGGVPFRYDWRSKAEPLLWIADAICGVTAEHLLEGDHTIFDRLANAGIIEVDNV